MSFKDTAASFSTGGLLMMHKALRDAFDKDEQTPADEEKRYGVRLFSDWKQWSDAMEAELAVRTEPFVPVPW